MPPEAKFTIEREVRIAASPETIFAFFTDPIKLIKWKGMKATLVPKPGGLYRVDINGRDVARGEYIEITPYSRIVFTWGWEGEGHPVPPGSTTVEITLIPDGEETIVRLRHYDLGNQDAVNMHIPGWDHFLSRLIVAAQGGDPGPDRWD